MDTLPSSVEGVFFNIKTLIKDQQTIRIFNDKNIPFFQFKTTCDKIARYLIDEGFVTTKKPRIEVQTK